MKHINIFCDFIKRTAVMLSVMLLTIIVPTNLWADNNPIPVSLSVDDDFAEGTPGRHYVNMPTTGTNTLTLNDATITSFKVYDDGGKGGTGYSLAETTGGNYSNDCDGTLTLTAPEGYILQLAGAIRVVKPDNLSVYDGDQKDNTKYLIDAMTGNYGDFWESIPTVVSTGRNLTLYFSSNYDRSCDGIDLTVMLINPNAQHSITIPTTDGGTVSASPTSAIYNQMVALSSTPNNGYLLNNLSVADVNGKDVTVTDMLWYTGTNTATFLMPGSTATVTPTYTNTWTAEGGLYINMPVSGIVNVTIPSGVQSFKVYDDGGEGGTGYCDNNTTGGNYRNDCDGTLTLTAPEGYILQMSGTVKTGYDDGKKEDVLTVYDNNEASGTKLLDAVCSLGPDDPAIISNVFSSGQSMTLCFKTDDSYNYEGLDLTITLIKTDAPKDITLNTATGGTVKASATSAIAGTSITVTATPDTADGYMLDVINVTDESNNEVEIEGGTWFTSNIATFQMPNSSVSVTPIFTTSKTANSGLHINMPRVGAKNATIPVGVQSFKVYDDGGKNSNYSNFCSSTLVLTAPDGYILQLSGSITTENFDELTVYDGSNNTSTKLLDKVFCTNKGTETAITTVTSTGRSMTIFFESNNINNYAGLDLTVSIINPSELFGVTLPSATTGGTIITDKASAATHENVTLTATPDTEHGYMLDNIKVTSSINDDIEVEGGTWFTSNTATFQMPSSNVTVTPTFTTARTADDGLFINMPMTGNKKAIIPSGVQSFKVYDDGGENGNYSNDCNGTLTLTAPEGYILELKGSITTNQWDELTVYDGNNNTSAKLLDAEYNSSGKNIKTVYSTDRYMTLYFGSSSYSVNSGLNLTVSLINPNESLKINISDTEGGTVTADPTEAQYNEDITLTAKPSANYWLKNISVVDAYNNTIAVSDWSSSFDRTVTSTFTMPRKDVTVTPTFSNTWTAAAGLFINMPATGSSTLDIPEGVQSFKVYSDGGANGKYSNNSNGELLLTAPAGYVLQLSGDITTDGFDDVLTVYDGNNNTATKLLDDVHSSKIGINTDITTVCSTNQSMMICFTSDDYNNYSGLNLTVTIINPSTLFGINMGTLPEGCIVTTDKPEAKVNEIVTVTAKPGENYMLKDISIVDANNAPVPVYNRIHSFCNTFTFQMPGSAVTITPTFIEHPTAADDIFVSMPATGKESVSIPNCVKSFKVYDDGGKGDTDPYTNKIIGGEYSYNCNGSLTLTAPEGYVLKLSGSAAMEKYHDFLTVYDGNDSSCPMLLDHVSTSITYNSENKNSFTPIPNVYSTGQNMTLTFESDEHDNYSGLDLTVTIIAPNTLFGINMSTLPEGCIVTTDKSEAKVNEIVTVTVKPANNQIANNLVISEEDGYTFDVLSGSKTDFATVITKFKMPASDITITPTFTPVTPADDELYINMPATGNASVVIPDDVFVFKLYDNGGKGGTGYNEENTSGGNYSNDCNGMLTLTAPEDHILYISGSTDIYHDDILTIYDGDDASGTKLLDENSSANCAVCSTGQNVTIGFKSSKWNTDNGWDLTVKVIDPNELCEIDITPSSGGNVTADPTSAKLGDTVTLTAAPDTENGYLLKSISVLDDMNCAVDITDMLWYTGKNTATFTMPPMTHNTKLTVVPTFTNNLTAEEGLVINLPNSYGDSYGNTFNIPDNVKSFKVHEGDNHDYAELFLNASTGYEFQLSGSILQLSRGYLTVYDGSDTSSPRLLSYSFNRNDTETTISTVTSSCPNMIIMMQADKYGKPKNLFDLTVTKLEIIIPKYVKVSPRSTSVKISWIAHRDSYEVRYRKAEKSGDWTTVPTTEMSVEITGLEKGTQYEYQIIGIKEGEDNTQTEIATFTTSNENERVFVTAGNWDNADNWIPNGIPTEKEKAIIQADVIIPDGVEATAKFIELDGGSITMKDGGQIKTETDGLTVTIEKNITAGRNYLIGTPLSETTNLHGTTNNNLASGSEYDLYYFDASKEEEWREFCYATTISLPVTTSILRFGRGYLYASKEDKTLSFTGTTLKSMMESFSGVRTTVTYNETSTATFNGWFLVSNRFPCNSYLSYFSDDGHFQNALYLKLKADGTMYEEYQKAVKLAPGEAAFIKVDKSGYIFNFTKNMESEGLAPVFVGYTYLPYPPQHGEAVNQDASTIILLANDQDNTTKIEGNNGKMATVLLQGRTIYCDGDWNTLCLPFNVDNFKNTPLAGATVKTLSSTSYNNGTLTLNFEDATSIKAGEPYLVKWNNAPYLTINTTADWNAFAESVNNGKTYAGKKVVLGKDVENVSTMVGTAQHPFCGTFDGNGHNLKLKIDGGTECAAPFRYIKGATIQYLWTNGTVKGGLHSAGLVGFALSGTNNIHNCAVKTELFSSATHIGGLLGHGTTSNTTISDCYADIIVHDENAQYLGIIYGWGDGGGSHTIRNCLVSGYLLIGNKTKVELLCVNGGATSISNCYKDEISSAGGTPTQGINCSNMTSAQLSTALGNQWFTDSQGYLDLDVVGPSTTSYKNIENPQFDGVTICSDASPEETSYVDFVGTYAPLSFTDTNTSILFLGADNTLYYPKAGATIGACRAYFQLKGLTISDISETRIFFGDSDSEDGINSLTPNPSAVGEGSIYNLSGQKLSKPQKGINIVNGKKVLF
ncbi:MAG: fibronectin type III domain-containing protein [Bacteroidaceae bacterium]|nr:fibronectin type III domain-containing protein [Bacteroidaceae bacterium]